MKFKVKLNMFLPKFQGTKVIFPEILASLESSNYTTSYVFKREQSFLIEK